MKKIYTLFSERIIEECDMWQVGNMVMRMQPFLLLFFCSIVQEGGEKTTKSREKIVALLAENSRLSAVALAERIGISAKAVEKHLAKLKADGTIERVGPAKGGYWRVV